MNIARKVSIPRMAVKLYPRRDYIPRATTNALRRKWIAANERLGPQHILRGGLAKWGNRGDLAVLVIAIVSGLPWEWL